MRKLFYIFIAFLILKPSICSSESTEFSDTCFVIRGDIDHGGGSNPIGISDLTFLVDYLFLNGSTPYCLMETDTNADGELTISDLTFLVTYLFLGGAEPVQVPGIDYVVYTINDLTYNRTIFGYHVLSEIIDTFLNDFAPQVGYGKNIGLSADGHYLFYEHSDSTAVVNTTTKNVDFFLPYSSWGGTASSPNGNYVAFMGDSLSIVNASDYSLLFSDTVSILDGLFSDNSLRFYGATGNELYIVDLENDFSVDSIYFHAGVIDVDVSSDESKYFVYTYCGHNCSFIEIYDAVLDSIVYYNFIAPGAGHIVAQRNDSLLFYTNPGTNFHGVTPSFNITVFDIESLSVIDSLMTSEIQDCVEPPTIFPVNDVLITPDGRWLLGIGALGLPAIFKVDLETLEIVHCFSLQGEECCWMFDLVVRSKK